MQTEEGDLFKVTIDHEDEEVQALKIKYFDTVPVSSSLTILKSGFLFVAAEMGNQFVFNCLSIGEFALGDDSVAYQSHTYCVS